MKAWKRLGGALITLLALTVMLTGTAMAAEPAQKGIEVQLNGGSLAFTDAVPEITGSRTYVPFRAVLEAMGAEVGYDAQTRTVSARRDGVAVTMVPGQKEMTVTEDGQTRTVKMNAAPYIKESNGRTYVPIRYAAEALGYTVGWDADSRAVIIVDVDALFGDATFKLMDSFAAYSEKQNTLDNAAVTGKLSIEAADRTGETLPKPVRIGGSIDGIVGEKGAQLTGKLNLSGMEALFGEFGETPLEQAMIKAMLETLSNMNAELRMDLEKGMLYFYLPAGLTGEENTWYSVDFSAYQAELLSALNAAQLAQLKDAGIKESLVWVMENLPLDDVDTSYATLAELAKVYTDMLSDQAFTKSGNTHKAKMVLEDIVNLEVTLTQRGQDIVAMDIVMTASAEEDGMKVAMTMTENASPGKVTAKLTMTMQDEDADLKFDFDLSCAPTRKTPAVTPPASAKIVPMS